MLSASQAVKSARFTVMKFRLSPSVTVVGSLVSTVHSPSTRNLYSCVPSGRLTILMCSESVLLSLRAMGTGFHPVKLPHSWTFFPPFFHWMTTGRRRTCGSSAGGSGVVRGTETGIERCVMRGGWWLGTTASMPLKRRPACGTTSGLPSCAEECLRRSHRKGDSAGRPTGEADPLAASSDR